MATKIWRNDTEEDAFVMDVKGVFRQVRPGEVVVGDFFQQVDSVLTYLGPGSLPLRSGRSLHVVGRRLYAEPPMPIYPLIEVMRL